MDLFTGQNLLEFTERFKTDILMSFVIELTVLKAKKYL
jgi:hypothetical protein